MVWTTFLVLTRVDAPNSNINAVVVQFHRGDRRTNRADTETGVNAVFREALGYQDSNLE